MHRSIKRGNFDTALFITVIISAILGIIAVYSATRSYDTNTNVIIQSASFLLGTAVMLIVSYFDYEHYEYLIKYIYGACVFLLVLVLIIGKSGTWGAKSWIRIGAIGIQPSEIAKVGFAVTLSYHLSRVGNDVNKPSKLLALLLHLGVLVGLIGLQPDMGSGMVFIFMFAVMLFTAGLSFKYILPAIGVGVVSLPVIYKFFLSEYQKNRIRVFLNPELDPFKSGYNVIQSKIAVGSGGFFGKGFLNGTQNQLGLLPTKHTDFIFSVVSEEFGFVGSAAVILLLFVIIVRCLAVAKATETPFGKFICVGVASMMLFHWFENVGMCMGLTPVTGIPLPFFSYGGTSLITNMLAIGLVLGVSRQNRKPRRL